MAKIQKMPVGTELKSSVVQHNLQDLYESAHDHLIKSSLPAAKEGSKRDIIVVDDGTNVYICVKTSRGWFRTAALTAI